MKKLLLLAVVTLAASAQSNGWIPLFNGRTLNGWRQEGQATWIVANGTIVADKTGDGWLRSDQTYSNFLLKLDYRNSPKGNSGVFLRATKESNREEACNPAGGYELQIYNEDPKWATGSIEDVIQRLVTVNPAPNQWHTYAVEVNGDRLVAGLDGKKVLDGRDPKIKSGYLGLQHHKDMKIEFRNILLKPISK